MFDAKQLQKMQKELQERMTKVQEDMKNTNVDASSGGGMVTATVNGNQELVSLKFKPEAVDPDDIEMLEDLVIAAVNQAIEKSKELSQEQMSQVTGGIKIPGLF
jgi:DNA-binding YbaB/EbfC family protein